MLYKDYLAKRQALCDQIQDYIEAGDLGSEYLQKCADVEKLDQEYDREKMEENAMAKEAERFLENQEKSIPPWVKPGTTADILTLNNNAKNSDPLFLGSGRRMVDVAREQHPDQVDLLNDKDALGDAIRGIVTGHWKRPELKNSITTSGTSVIIPSVLSAGIVDLARDLSLFGAANVPTIPMETNNVTISRVASDPVFKFKQEGSAASESSFSLDSVTLNAKTIYGYAYVTLEAIESSRNLDGIIRQVFAEAMARGIDRTMLYGQYNEGTSGYDTFAPSGIMRDGNILTHQASADGVSYADFIKAIAKIRKNNGVPSVVAINAATDELLQLLTDNNGVYLQAPKAYADLQQIITNELDEDEDLGSDALVFDPGSMLIGIQNSIRIKLMDQGDEQLKKGVVAFQIYAMLDCKVVRPKAICKITGITGPSGSSGASGQS